MIKKISSKNNTAIRFKSMLKVQILCKKDEEGWLSVDQYGNVISTVSSMGQPIYYVVKNLKENITTQVKLSKENGDAIKKFLLDLLPEKIHDSFLKTGEIVSAGSVKISPRMNMQRKYAIGANLAIIAVKVPESTLKELIN